MIEPSSNNGRKVNDYNNIKDDKATLNIKAETPGAQKQGKILNIYEEHIKITSPTYSEDVKAVMKKQGIKESNLNAKIVETMKQSGLDVTKDSLNFIVNQLQEGHLFELFEQGYSIQNLTVDIISKEILKNEINPEQKDKEEDSQASDVEKALTEVGLPITNKNIEVLEQYKEKVEDVMDNSDLTASNMVRHNSDTTINNLYLAKHKGEPKNAVEVPTDEQIIAVLSMNGIRPTRENINAARSLVVGSIEITTENIDSFIKVKEMVGNIDTGELLNEAATAMKKGDSPGDVNINPEIYNGQYDVSYDEVNQAVKDILEDIPSIDETVIEDTYKKGQPITMENLQKTLHENIDKVLEGIDDIEVEPQEISTTKRQLEEIRLSLTLEAALKLSSKLDIQTTELAKVVEELKVIEKENNEEILRNIGAPVTEENVEQLKQTSDKLYNISQNKEIAMAEVVKDEADFTIDGMDEAIKLKHAQNIYEETGTRPERRFGEGIARVEEQIEHILNMNEIEPTESNIRAAKALIENNINISPEAVQGAKEVLLKIETVLHELKPATVAQILKEGIRPDTMPIDSLIDHIREIQKDANVDPSQKVAEGILELDKANQLNVKEREGLVAVYRMLSTIKKNETAAIGFLLDNNKEPTLGNLFEASKYIKQIGSKTGKMDVTVDDDLGIREGELPTNIRSLIESATNLQATDENIDKWIHTNNVIKQWLSRITPEELKKYIDMDKSLEELELKDGKLSPFESERVSKQVESLGKVSPHTLSFLKEHNIAPTIPNIYWTDRMIKDPYLLGNMLEDYEKITGEEIKSSINKDDQSIDEVLDKLETELEEQGPQWLSSSQSMDAYRIGKDLEQMLSTQRKMAENDGIYQIPIQLHHGMSNLNLYVMKDKEHSNQVENNELKAYMSIKTKNIGLIQVNMRISDNSLAFEMIGETPEITLDLQKDSKELKASIEDIGYRVMHAKFTPGRTKTSIIDKPQASESLLKYRFEDSKFEHII